MKGIKKVGSKKPLFLLVREELIKLIDRWDVSNPLPSESNLSKMIGVSRSTIREAISGLENAGILYKHHGVGTFVHKNKSLIITSLENLRGVQNIIKSLGKEMSLKEQKTEIVKADNDISESLQIPKGEKIFKITQVYLADKIPILIGISYIHPSITEDDFERFSKIIIDGSKRGKSLFEILEKNTNKAIQYAIARIEAVIVGTEKAEILEIDESQPLVYLYETHYDYKNFPLIVSEDYIDARRFNLSLLRRRKF